MISFDYKFIPVILSIENLDLSFYVRVQGEYDQYNHIINIHKITPPEWVQDMISHSNQRLHNIILNKVCTEIYNTYFEE